VAGGVKKEEKEQELPGTDIVGLMPARLYFAHLSLRQTRVKPKSAQKERRQLSTLKEEDRQRENDDYGEK
jgi:hypothetical protein